MPSHFHPRSRMTSTLFASTLAVCFLVVGMPHILPCPAPRVAFADAERGEDGRVRRKQIPVNGQQPKETMVVSKEIDSKEDPFGTPAKGTRECPVPKPGGTIGQVLGFNKKDGGE